MNANAIKVNKRNYFLSNDQLEAITGGMLYQQFVLLLDSIKSKLSFNMQYANVDLNICSVPIPSDREER